MKRTAKGLVLVALLTAMGSVAVSQESIEEILEGQGFDWMVGQWKASMDDGRDIVIGFQLAAKGHALVHDFKMGDRSSHRSVAKLG